MNRWLYIIPECYADTNLITTLLQAEVNHQKGCNQVVNTMQEKYAQDFAVGIIDCDKRTPVYLSEMKMLAKSQHLQLYKHPLRPHYMITIRPAIEGFTLACAEELNINPTVYGVAPSLSGLKQQTKRVDSNKDPQLRALFSALRSSTEMTILSNALQYLNEQQYQADTNHLKDIFSVE